MAYTPINWATGDTITAEKLNRCDNGWSVSKSLSTVFDGSITTTDGNNRQAEFVPSANFATASEIVVTLDGVTYNLVGFDDGGYWTWGAPYGDFSVYPFNIYVNGDRFMFVSQTAGTYMLQIQTSVGTVETSPDFSSAVNSCVDVAHPAVLCVPDVTAITDVSGKLPFFFDPYSNKLHIIVTPAINCEIVPESNTITAHFNRETGLFYITTN